MNRIRIISIVFGILLFVFWLPACMRIDEFPAGKKIACDAEKLNYEGNKLKEVNDTTILFNDGEKQTDIVAHSGNYSVYTTSEKKYAFGYVIKHAGPDWYFKVSVWRKSKNGNGSLAVAGKNSAKFYESISESVKRTGEGWEKLELEVFTPPWFNNDQLTFYVWNNGSDTVYFDDFKIERLEKKIYPVYSEKPLSIVIDTTDYLKIEKKREEAFVRGILQTSDNDWVKAIVFGNDKMMKAKIRLKGDWLDHLKGKKWSFRIKMKKNYAWNRLRTFSIQTPAARDFLKEWQAHQYYQNKDVLTTRYGFVPFIFNNRSLGIYAWEEHFDKQLIEWRSRREGPILKFSEEAFWEEQLNNYFRNTEKWIKLPYYQAAVIKPFKQSRTITKPNLYNEFINGQKLLNQFKYHQKPPGSIFDVQKLARYFAMTDLTDIQHGMAWHNQRFYFNPVLCKLEPIAYDCYSGNPYFKEGINIFFGYSALNNSVEISPEQYLMYDLFTDSTFVSYYLKYLEQVSTEEYITSMTAELKPKLNYYDSLIRLEFPHYEFDSEFISSNAREIRQYLPELKKFMGEKLHDPDFKFNVKHLVYNDTTVFQETPELFVTAYLQKKDDSSTLRVYNYFQRNLIILGTGKNKKYVDCFFHPEPRMKPYHGQEEIQAEFVSDTNANYLFFMIDGRFDTYSVEINHWPYPEGNTPQQELFESVDLNKELLIDKIIGKNIYVKKGELRVEHPVVIPQGYRVYFRPGTKINFVNDAMFISYSPLFMQGEENNPIVISSSDFSMNGFTVLQADERSFLNFVVFENMNTLDYKGWTLTGSVSFYESDVTIKNTTFYRNQCEDALNTIRSAVDVENAKFDYIYGDAFDSDFCTGKLSKTVFSNIGNDAIDFSGSRILIDHVNVNNASDKGISAGEESYLTVKNSTISKANIGLASKDLSVLEFDNGELTDCNYGIVLLQKKPEFGPAKAQLNRSKIINPKTKMLIELNSQLVMDGDTIKGEKEKLADIFYQ